MCCCMLLVKIGDTSAEAEAETALTISFAAGAPKSEKEHFVARL